MEQLQLHCLSFLKNEMMDITKMSRQEVAPAVDGLLQRCQPTKAAAERSFSILNKLLLPNTKIFTEEC